MPIENPLFKQENKEVLGKRKYYYHGTIAEDFPDINREGLRIKEGHATLSIALSFTLKYWSKPASIIDQRKRKNQGNTYDSALDKVRSAILVVEPKDYSVSHISSFPEETTDEVYFRNHWERHHQALYEPGNGSLLKERLKIEKIPKEGVIPPDQIKMALLPTPELSAVLNDFTAELAKGSIPQNEYVLRLSEYLKSGNGVLKDEIADKKDLAAEIIDGEIEQFIITTVRKLFLSIKHYQGKYVYTKKVGSEVPAKTFDKDKIQPTINNLKLLDVKKPVLQRYLRQSIFYLEQELLKLN